MRQQVLTVGLTAFTLSMPFVSSAQSIFTIFNTASVLVNAIIALLIGFGVVAFFWGLVKYLLNAGEEKQKGLSLMMYGIIGLTVMLSIYGLIRLLQNTFGIGGAAPLTPPQVTGLGTFN